MGAAADLEAAGAVDGCRQCLEDRLHDLVVAVLDRGEHHAGRHRGHGVLLAQALAAVLQALQAVGEPVLFRTEHAVACAQGLGSRLEAEQAVVVVPVGGAFARGLEGGELLGAEADHGRPVLGSELGDCLGAALEQLEVGGKVRDDALVVKVAVDLERGQQAGVAVFPLVIVGGVVEAPGGVALGVGAQHLEQVVDVERDDYGDLVAAASL